MKLAIASLESTTPYSQSGAIDITRWPKKPKETPDAYEERTWRGRIHASADGHVEIPSTQFVGSIREAARRLQIQVPGKGKTLYTKYFEAGVDCAGAVTLPVKADDVPCDRLYVPSDGRPGGGKRVWKNFCRIDRWAGEVTFYVLDDMITETVFLQVLRSAGILVGIGRFRPQNRGFYGRFTVRELRWVEDGDAALASAAE